MKKFLIIVGLLLASTALAAPTSTILQTALPGANNTYNLGSPTLTWANIYGGNYFGNGSNLTGITSFTTTTINGLSSTAYIFATSSPALTITGSGNTLTFSLPTSTASITGVLTGTDWTTFNNKQNSLGSNFVSSTAGTAPIFVSGSTGAVTISLGLTAVSSTRQIITTAPIFGGGDLSADRTLSLGFTIVSSTRAINAGLGISGGGDLSADRTLTLNMAGGTCSGGITTLNATGTVVCGTLITTSSISGTAPIFFSNAGVISLGLTAVSSTRAINTANGIAGGGDLSADRTIYLASTFATSGNSGITVASSSGNTWTWSQPTSTASQSGFLTSADWNTFNNKQNNISFPLPVASTSLTAGNMLVLTGNSLAATTTPSFTSLSLTNPLLFSSGGTATTTAFSSGSILFSNGSSLAENNANLFWNNTSSRMGIGTISPGTSLAIVGSGNALVVVGSSTAVSNVASGKELQINSDGSLNTNSFLNLRANTTNANTNIGGIAFTNTANVTTSLARNAQISVQTDNATDTASGIMKFGTTNAAGTLATAMTIDQNGNMGVGTTTPSGLLNIYSTAGNDQLILDAVAGKVTSLNFKSGGIQNWVISARGTYDAPNSRLSFWDTGGNERITFLQGGNVGIGTTAPAHTLHATRVASTTTRTARFDMTGGTAGTEYIVGQFDVGGTGAQSPALVLSSNSTIGLKLTHSSNFTVGTIDQNYSSAVGLAFAVRGSEKMRVDNNGNVGIGTSTPTATLDVRGNTNFGNQNVSGSTSTVYLAGDTAATSTSFVLQRFGSAENIAFQTNSSNNQMLSTSKNFKIGTTDALLTQIQVNGNIVMTVSSTNVGIGTTNPATTLHLNSASSTLQIGGTGNLTSCLIMQDMASSTANPKYMYVSSSVWVITSTQPTFCMKNG